ncbi:hypothetical protein [Amycolatopsis sp. NPDC003731]
MTLTATYNDDLARVQLAVTGAPAAADYARFERTTDNITWTDVRGGQTVGLTGAACRLDDFEFVPGVTNFYRASYVDTGVIPATTLGQDTANLTPSMVDVWLKNVLRPNLNQKVRPAGRISISRKSRSATFDIVGRTVPVAVTDVRGAREFQLQLLVDTWAERDVLDNVLGTGDVLQLHVPPGSPTTSAFVMVGDTTYDDATGLYTLPLTEVARPDGTLIGETILWLDVTAEYATWADVLAAEPTWSDLVSQIASGSSTIVP